MRQRHISVATKSGTPRTKRFVIGSLGIVLTVTATSGLAVAAHSSEQNPKPAGTTNLLPKSDLKSATNNVSHSEATQGEATATNSSSTTVSINGETIQVNDDGSYDRVYETNNGSTHVNISVHNTSSSYTSDSSQEGSME